MINGIAFVDDADHVNGAKDLEIEATALIPDLQQSLNRWCGLLRATGGFIAQKKSKWWLINFEWSNNNYHYRLKEEFDQLALSILQGDSEAVAIDQLDVQDAVESLGIWITMDGT